VLLNKAPHSASAAEDITLRIMVELVNRAPLLRAG
jgi:hypothetical protein